MNEFSTINKIQSNLWFFCKKRSQKKTMLMSLHVACTTRCYREEKKNNIFGDIRIERIFRKFSSSLFYIFSNSASQITCNRWYERRETVIEKLMLKMRCWILKSSVFRKLLHGIDVFNKWYRRLVVCEEKKY